MRVKVRLASGYPESENNDWRLAPNLQILAALFPADPLVASDETGYYLSATALDEADDDPSLDFFVAAGALLARVNGAAALIAAPDLFTPARRTGDYEGVRSQRPGPTIRATVATYSRLSIDPQVALDILAAIEAEPALLRILDLVSTARGERVWLDLWRVIDILKDVAPPTGETFEQWAKRCTSAAEWTRFKRTNNDPTFGGVHKRHTAANPASSDSGNPMEPHEGVDFARRLVASWLQERFGIVVNFQVRDKGELPTAPSSPTDGGIAAS